MRSRLVFGCRERDLSALRSLHALRKHVLLIGPPGIGKSAILRRVQQEMCILVCETTSDLNSIFDALERQIDDGTFQLNGSGRKDRLLAMIRHSKQIVAFDHVGLTEPEVARFIIQIAEHNPIWICTRFEQPYDLGKVWNHLSDFVRLEVRPLKKSETRALIARSVENGTVTHDALENFSLIWKLSQGNPRRLEEILLQLRVG